jgi:hypothetical protein
VTKVRAEVGQTRGRGRVVLARVGGEGMRWSELGERPKTGTGSRCGGGPRGRPLWRRSVVQTNTRSPRLAVGVARVVLACGQAGVGMWAVTCRWVLELASGRNGRRRAWWVVGMGGCGSVVESE